MIIIIIMVWYIHIFSNYVDNNADNNDHGNYSNTVENDNNSTDEI